MTPWQRKRTSEAIFRKKGIPFLAGLPVIKPEEKTRLRTPEEVGIRIACLFAVVGHAFEPSSAAFEEYLEKHGLQEHLTPQEAAFMSNPAPDRRDVINFTWRSEALFLLMWTVGLFDELPWPDHQTDTGEIVSKFPDYDQSPWPFIQCLKLRPKSEILDAADLIYRLHWTTQLAEPADNSIPDPPDPALVHEWRHAINWLTMFEGMEWDQVTTDD